jgi:FKBP-type peptidyl-prolyl cis-trans isomerase
MMKMKWILLFSLWSIALQVSAEEPVVIDNQSIGEQPADSKADVNTVAPSDPQAEANAANKEQFLKGGKMSPRERAAVAKAAMADTNKQEGDSFLETNKTKQGVTTLPSGVQYKILRAGNGKRPTEDSMVRCRYKGTLIDGSTIDKTDDKKPSVMHVAGFLPGLKEAVKLMPTGSKWEIVVPPQLAYGAFGNRGIGPNAVLIYEMEILGIK